MIGRVQEMLHARAESVRGLAYLYEHMFPRLKQNLLAHLDLVVELSTLGEYGIAEDGRVMPLEPEAQASPLVPRFRDECGQRLSPTARGCAVTARP